MKSVNISSHPVPTVTDDALAVTFSQAVAFLEVLVSRPGQAESMHDDPH